MANQHGSKLDDSDIKKIADAIQAYGRKASSGEPLFFDRNNLERVIKQALEDK